MHFAKTFWSQLVRVTGWSSLLCFHWIWNSHVTSVHCSCSSSKYVHLLCTLYNSQDIKEDKVKWYIWKCSISYKVSDWTKAVASWTLNTHNLKTIFTILISWFSPIPQVCTDTLISSPLSWKLGNLVICKTQKSFVKTSWSFL